MLVQALYQTEGALRTQLIEFGVARGLDVVGKSGSAIAKALSDYSRQGLWS